MRFMVLAVLASLPALPVLAAPAEEPIIAPAFSGTIVSTYPDGRTSRLWLNRDGSFSAEGRSHERQAGRWRIKANSICLSQLKPVVIPFLSYCAAIPSSGVSASWTGKAVTGEPIVNHLVSDRTGAPTG